MQIPAKSVQRESMGRVSGRRYRIAMVAACPFPYPRGTPIRVDRLAEALSRRGHDVHVITYHLGSDLPTPAFEVHRTPVVRTYNLKHEINALVVPNGDTRGMAEAMLRLLDCPVLARRLGDQAHREAAANFSWDRAARESEAVYGRVLARRVANQLDRTASRPVTCH